MPVINQTQQEIDSTLINFPDSLLFDIGRNESAIKSWRKAAVALLLDKKSRLAQHVELRELRLEIEEENKAKIEVEAVVEAESAISEGEKNPAPEQNPALRASFTTANQ